MTGTLESARRVVRSRLSGAAADEVEAMLFAPLSPLRLAASGLTAQQRADRAARARDLRAQGWTIEEIADEIGVSHTSVQTWVRRVSRGLRS